MLLRRQSPHLIGVHLALFMGMGCSSGLEEDVSALRQRLEELSQHQSTSQQSIDDLNNRLFLLEDKIDTRTVAQQRVNAGPLRLPVVRLGPSGTTVGRPSAPPQQPEPIVATDGETGDAMRPQRASVVADHPIAYGGEATDSRPVLRLHGRGDDVGILAEDKPTETNGRSAPAHAVSRAPAPARTTTRPRLAAKSKTTATPPVADELTPYRDALSLYRAGDYAGAARGFAQFVEQHGSHPYTDNALYWQGECLYAREQYAEALGLFRRVVEEHPTGNKVPAALLKMGYSYARLDQRDEARSVLSQVVDVFPHTQVARLASEALAAL